MIFFNIIIYFDISWALNLLGTWTFKMINFKFGDLIQGLCLECYFSISSNYQIPNKIVHKIVLSMNFEADLILPVIEFQNFVRYIFFYYCDYGIIVAKWMWQLALAQILRDVHLETFFNVVHHLVNDEFNSLQTWFNENNSSNGSHWCCHLMIK